MSAGFLMCVCKCSLEMKPSEKRKQRNLHKQPPARGRGACSKHGRARAHLRLQQLCGSGGSKPAFDGGKWWKCSMKVFKQKQNKVEGATRSWLKREECDLIRRLIAAAHVVDTAGWNVPANRVPENGITSVWSGKDHTNLQVLLQTPTLVC